ncbi:MAG: hypothetical protein WB784_09265 [Rhodanobacteraceae bacterium]
MRTFPVLLLVVIADNDTSGCFFHVPGNIEFHTDRYNMDSDDTCELASGSSNYRGVEPYPTPLGDYGGFTKVSWPLTISPTIDMGHPVIGDIGCEADFRHYVERPIDFDGDGDARCGVGAGEMSDDVIFFGPFDRL